MKTLMILRGSTWTLSIQMPPVSVEDRNPSRERFSPSAVATM
jgi:hypothetical protein